eukprot:s4152_g3.t1
MDTFLVFRFLCRAGPSKNSLLSGLAAFSVFFCAHCCRQLAKRRVVRWDDQSQYPEFTIKSFVGQSSTVLHCADDDDEDVEDSVELEVEKLRRHCMSNLAVIYSRMTITAVEEDEEGGERPVAEPLSVLLVDLSEDALQRGLTDQGSEPLNEYPSRYTLVQSSLWRRGVLLPATEVEAWHGPALVVEETENQLSAYVLYRGNVKVQRQKPRARNIDVVVAEEDKDYPLVKLMEQVEEVVSKTCCGTWDGR